MVYATYDFYQREWHGAMLAAEFERWAARASLEIDRITTGRAAGAPAVMERALAICCCTIADHLQAWDGQDTATQGGVVASESVDGLSVSYRNDGAADARSASRKRTLHNACADLLTWPVNLLYTGVGR